MYKKSHDPSRTEDKATNALLRSEMCFVYCYLTAMEEQSFTGMSAFTFPDS